MRASTFVRRLVGSVVASAVCGALLATVPSVATAQAATAPLPWLTTSGNHIVSADTGQEVLLRGANIGRSEWDMRMDTERRAIPALAGTWKGNMILRGFASDAVLGNDATYLGLLDEYVALAAANRMYVMFAWRSHEINGQQPTMPDDRAQEALARLATRYHGVPHVMYALQVEPHDVTWSQLHPRYTSMVAAVRRAAAPHEPIIMVPGTHWSRDVSGALTQPIPGADIVYKTHPYNTVDDFQRHFGSVVDAGLPVFIGEFGYLPEHGMHMADIDALMRYANTKRLGWAAWAFDVDGNPGLVSDNTTFDPSWPYGHAVKNQMVNTPPVPTATPVEAGRDEVTWATDPRPFAADVTLENVHRPAIEALHVRQVVRGCDAAGLRYCPDASVTRGQVATLLVRALALPPATGDHFGDDAASPHEENVNRIAEAGLATGFANGAFEPSRPVTRAQMATLLVRGFSLPPAHGGHRFVDVAGVHDAAIAALVRSGITIGCDARSERFCPSNDVRRDQVSTFLLRALDA
jgi:hypothetical protein